jgi:hypothetical protein
MFQESQPSPILGPWVRERSSPEVGGGAIASEEGQKAVHTKQKHDLDQRSDKILRWPSCSNVERV